MGATEQKPQKSTTQQALNSTNLEKIRSVFCVFGRSNLRGNSKTVRIQQQEFQHCNIRNGRSSCFPVGRQSQLHLVPWRVFDKWVVLKKQSENIDSIHSNSVTHAATQIHPLCLISIQNMSTLCQYHVHVYHVIAIMSLHFLSPRNGLVGTVRFLGATYFAPGLHRIEVMPDANPDVVSKVKKEKYIYKQNIYIYTHNNSFC